MTPKAIKSTVNLSNRAQIERALEHSQPPGTLARPDCLRKIAMRAVRQPLTLRRYQSGILLPGDSLFVAILSLFPQRPESRECRSSARLALGAAL